MIKDLTRGNPSKIMRQFTMPLFISVIFQQLYNIADSIIVGNFATRGEDVLACWLDYWNNFIPCVLCKGRMEGKIAEI